MSYFLQRSGLALALCFFLQVVSAQTTRTGEIDGAKFIIDVPAKPSGDVLLLARGFRPDFFPLSAVYEVETAFYQTLLAEGWIIASTSYQTNDWVVSKGGEDVLALRDFVHKEVFPIKRAVVYGETMGGGVAVWLAENETEAIDGVFALGAYLYPEPKPDTETPAVLASVFTAEPKLPILFVANAEEIGSSQAYLDGISSGAKYQPITWSISRSGHVNVNSAERLSAMRALLGWMDGDSIESMQDAMQPMSPDSQAAISKNSAAGTINRIRPLYGNVYSSFVANDMEALGVSIGDAFTLVHGESSFEVTYGKTYSDVPYGEWVAFIDPEGYVQLSRNYANAAETLGAALGDPILLIVK